MKLEIYIVKSGQQYLNNPLENNVDCQSMVFIIFHYLHSKTQTIEKINNKKFNVIYSQSRVLADIYRFAIVEKTVIITFKIPKCSRMEKSNVKIQYFQFKFLRNY